MKITLFQIFIFIALVFSFLIDCTYQTEISSYFFNTFAGMALGVVIYDTLNDIDNK